MLQDTNAAAAYGGDAAAGNARTALLGVTDSASAQTAINNLPTTIANIGAGAVTYLTAGADVVTGANIVGSLTSYIADGKGPTLNYNDVITGSTGGTNNTLTLNDDYAAGNDVIPLGASISNIQNVVLQTAGNAGGETSVFDTSSISGVTSVTVKSSGSSNDEVKAASTSDLNVSHLSTSGKVDAFGGNNVTVNTAAGTVTVGSVTTANVNPTGAVNVTAANQGTVSVYGGTTVTVNDAGQDSTINVGATGAAASSADPSGAVTVNATGAGADVNVYGGTNVTVSTVGSNSAYTGAVQVGFVDTTSNTVYAPTGDVTVTVNEAQAFAENYLTTKVSGYESDVTVVGGANVSVTTNAGDVTIGANATDTTGALLAGELPSGKVTVTDTSNNGNVKIYGGTDVTVTTNAGGVRVGSSSGTAGTEPSGNVTVTDTTAGFVGVFGGAEVAVNSAGGFVVVGSDNAGASATGDVSVTQSAVRTGGQFAYSSAVHVVGGDNVTVNTTGGNVTVGSAATPTTGAVVINDTFGGPNVDTVAVLGGTTVSINTTATSGAISVGNVLADIDSVTGALKNAGDYASGNVTIVNETAVGDSYAYGTGFTTVKTDGATSVSITGGVGANIEDIQTELANGVSTLSSVTLNHVETDTDNVVTIESDALTSLTILNGERGADYQVFNNTAGHALTLTLGGDATATPYAVDSISDSKAGSVIVNDNGVASGQVDLSIATATSLTVDTTAALKLDVHGAALTSITLNNTDSLALSGVSSDASLATIDASAATGAVSVEIAPNVTSFKGGAGNDVVTLDSNKLVHSDGTTYSTIAGGAGNNTLVANYAASTLDTALGNNVHISGFSTLELGSNAKSSTHDNGTVYTAPVVGVAGQPQLSTVTFAQADYGDSTGGSLSFVVHVTTAGTPPPTDPIAVVNYAPGIGESFTAFMQGLAQAVQESLAGTGLTSTYNALTGVITLVGPTDGSSTFTVDTFAASGDYAAYDASNPTTRPTVDYVTDAKATVVAVPGDAAYDAGGFSALQVGATAGDVAFTNVAAGTTLDVTASQMTTLGTTAVVNYVLADATGPKDALSLTVGNNTTGSAGVTTTIAAGGIETLNVASAGATGSANDITIADNEVTKVVLTGSNDVKLTIEGIVDGSITAAQSAVTNVDASATSGAVDLNIALSQSGATVKGGEGLLSVHVDANVGGSDVVTTGAGGGDIVLGNGGSWNSTTTAYGAGSESVDLSASKAAVDTIEADAGTVAVNNGSVGGVKGFQVTADAKTSDRLIVSSNDTTVNVLSNLNTAKSVVVAVGGLAAAATTAAGVPLDNLTYTVTNGVITFGAAGTHTVAEFTTAQLIAAAQALVEAAGPDVVVAFETGGNTYVVSSTAGSALHDSSVTELLGVTGVTGFGSTAAANTIVLGNVTVNGVSASDANIDSLKAVTYDDTGFAATTLSTSSAGDTSTSFTNLAASATLLIDGGTFAAVSTTQLGASGSDSLAVAFAGTTTVDSLTVNGDNALAFVANGSDVITKFVDATNTVASVTVSGTGSLEIDSLSGTALKSFDASGLTAGKLTLIAAQDGLSIVGSLHGDSITANGAADTITVGSSAAAALNAVSITANGASDTISLTAATTAATNHLVYASGAGDTITLNGGSHDTVFAGATINTSGSTPALTTALGHGDTVNLLGTGTDNVWVGSGSTVNLGSANHSFDGTLNLSVQGDVTGATSSGNFAQTTVNAVLADSANVFVSFGNAATETLAAGGTNLASSLVNVASATSLSQALDLAVQQSLVLDQHNGGNNTTVVNGVIELNQATGLITTFQYAGNTYVVEAVNNTNAAAVHSALGANDVVIELTGASATSATYTSGAVHATISAGQHSLV